MSFMASLPEGQSLPAAGSSTDTDDRASKKFPGRFTLTEGSKPKARFTFSEPSKKKATRRGSESRLSSNGRVMTQHEEWKNDIEEKVRAKEVIVRTRPLFMWSSKAASSIMVKCWVQVIRSEKRMCYFMASIMSESKQCARRTSTRITYRRMISTS